MSISLKTQNRPLLIVFALALGAFLWWLIKPFDMKSLALLDKVYESAVFVGVATIFTLWIGEIIPGKLKLFLVYWKIKHPTPGSSAFSDLMYRDYRIDCAALEVKHGPLPVDPSEQDRKFFAIYKPLDGEASIDDAHKSYLLFRELACLSAAFLVFGPVVAFALSKSNFAAAWFAATSTVLYVSCALAGQRAGRRFVSNVLAVASVKAATV